MLVAAETFRHTPFHQDGEGKYSAAVYHLLLKLVGRLGNQEEQRKHVGGCVSPYADVCRQATGVKWVGGKLDARVYHILLILVCRSVPSQMFALTLPWPY